MVTLVSVSDYGKTLQNQSRIGTLQRQMNKLQEQVHTGKKSTTFSGYGVDASITLSLRAQNTRLESYNDAIDRVLTRTSVMDTAMTNISSLVTDILSSMRTIVQTTDPSQATQTTRNVASAAQAADVALSQITARLNTRVDGRYVFSGDQVNAAPIPDSTLIRTNAAAIVDTIATGTAGATVLANINGMNATALGLNSSLATAGTVTVRADDNVDIDYTVKADSDFFQDILRSVGALSQMEFDPAHPADFWTVFNGIMSTLDSSGRTLDTKTGQLGQSRQQLTDIKEQNVDLMGLLEENIASTEDVDPAEALLSVNDMQTQLTASYQLIAQMKDMSLVNFL